MARIVSYNGIRVKTRKGSSGLGPKEKAAVGRLLSNPPRGGLKKSSDCVVVLFKSGGVAVQRCEGRKLRAHNRRQCRGRKKQFVRCK